MKEHTFDITVIGGGAAGMAAALAAEKEGCSVALVEREEYLGGILLQCIHNGFGLHEFKEELTGPEYAQRFADQLASKNITVFTQTTLSEISDERESIKSLFCYSSRYGVFCIRTKAVILAVGSRERNRGNIALPGTRPSGIYTAGLAQQLVNIDGYLVGRNIVIVGSGDIGLIMARRMSWAGAKVHAVLEIQEYPSGLTRNIVQCLNDFSIPLYLSHIVSNIYGKDRIERIDVTPLKEGHADNAAAFSIDCDTLLLSVGLVPENELAKKTGIELLGQTGGPLVDSAMMTSIPGFFACGNALHIHDLVDYVSQEARRAGTNAAAFIRGEKTISQYRIRAGANVRYTVPGRINPALDNTLFMRSMIVRQQAQIEIKVDNRVVKRFKKSHIQPSEMICFTLNKDDMKGISFAEDSVVEVGIVQ